MTSTKLQIAVLDCDTPVPNVYAERGLYSDIFARLLREAAFQTPGIPELDLRFIKYDSVLGKFPSQEELLQIDAIIITGSAASAYDPAPWILILTEYIRNLYNSHPRIKIFGSCFGHQLLCHTIFSDPYHKVVTRDPAGWELGIQTITLSAPFLAHYGPVLSNSASPSQLRQQFVHADHVVLSPAQLQSQGFKSIGQSAHCALQGVWKKGRVLTYQGHAEFDEFVNGETVKVFGSPIWSQDLLKSALASIEGEDDAVWAAGVMLKFFMESELEDCRDLNVQDPGEIHQIEDVTAVL